MTPKTKPKSLCYALCLTLFACSLAATAGGKTTWALSSAKGTPLVGASLSPDATADKGYLETLGEGWVFLSINATIKISWAKDDRELSIDSSDIYLLDQEDKKHYGIGSCMTTNLHGWPANKFWVSASDKTRVATQDFAFIVPKATKKLTLVMKGQKKAVSLTRPLQLKVLNAVKVRVMSSKVVKSVDYTRTVNSVKVGGRATNPDGDILQLAIVISWKQPHKKGERPTIYLNESLFTVRTDTGAWCPNYGKLVRDDGDYDWGWDDRTEKKKPLSAVYHFPVPKTAKAGLLYIAGQPVAKIRIR